MSVTKIDLCRYGNGGRSATFNQDMADMVCDYINGVPVYVEFDGSTDSRRTGSIGRLRLRDTFIQNVMHGAPLPYHSWNTPKPTRVHIHPDASLVKAKTFSHVTIEGHVIWDGRKNKVEAGNFWGMSWLKGRTAQEGTKWSWAKPDDPPAVTPLDKLGREINKGDFISYILYHFGGNNGNAAGIYYGKVTKIEADGTVHAKNIKLKDTDVTAEKRIKDNSLIVIMTKDLMDKLMLARLSVL